MPTTMIDCSGQPRSDEDILEAIKMLMNEIVVGSPKPIFVIYPTIINGLQELLERRGEAAINKYS